MQVCWVTPSLLVKRLQGSNDRRSRSVSSLSLPTFPRRSSTRRNAEGKTPGKKSSGETGRAHVACARSWLTSVVTRDGPVTADL
jgi:hypothetical protein